MDEPDVQSGLLFSQHFLREGIRTTEAYASLCRAEPDPIVALREALSDAFERFPVASRPDEAETEQDLVFRILEAIGWDRDSWHVQPRAARKGRSDVPDMLLFADAGAKARGNTERDKERRFRHGLVVIECKRWDRPLDRGRKEVGLGSSEREVPSTQMLRYLARAEVLSDRAIQFGFLTNGRLWRLYYQGAKSRSEEFFEIDLASILTLGNVAPDLLAPPPEERDHWQRVFLLLFGRAGFVERWEGDRSFHYVALDEGRLWEAKLRDNLARLVFGDVFPKLARALHAADRARPQVLDATYLGEVKNAALTFLYRVLFVLYAEDRELLPVRDPRYDDYGLRGLRTEIDARTAKGDVFAARIAHYWGHLRGLFRAIAEGEPSLGLPPYNGGLFDPEAAPLLERIELPDAELAPILHALSHTTVDGQRRWINYRDLSVQHLGSIYERLLEFDIEAHDDGVAVVEDDRGRRGSGSFYTPEVLVQLILERTVGPLVSERVDAFARKARALAGERRPKVERLAELAALDPATRLLELKVCDPAMGSGHFLVSLVDFLADRVLEVVASAPALVTFADDAAPYESPLIERLASIRARIVALAERHRWVLDEAQLDDRRLVRRMILKRVVHGVDKNPMAVELAKVALWLHTFTIGAPLSFLDHHLRCGDSLLGLWVGDATRWLQERGGLLVNRHVHAAQNAAGRMAEIEELTDADIAEVETSASTFEGVREATEPLTAFLSLLQAERLLGVLDAAPRQRPRQAKRGRRFEEELAAWERAHAFDNVLDGTFGDPVAIARGEIEIAPAELREQLSLLPDGPPEQASLFEAPTPDARLRVSAHMLLERTRALARETGFLHWQLAFPNVWRHWLGADPSGGFDAVIGNPPYVRQEQLGPIKPALKKAYRTYDGAADLYVYFYELGLRLLRPGGRLSFVVTNKWLRAGYAERLRTLFAEDVWLEAIIDFGHAKGFFKDADVFPCVIVARRPGEGEAPETTEACRIPRDLVRLERVSAQVRDLSFPLPRAAFTKRAWTIEPPEVTALLDKIRRNGTPLVEYAGVAPQYGIKTGCNEAFLIDTPTRDALVAADPGCAEIIKPYLRGQDIERWHAPWRGLWMIVMKSSSDHPWPWAHDERDAETRFASSLPSVYRHMKVFEDRLRRRQDRGRHWWELRPCSYYSMFSKSRIIYNDITWSLRFSFNNKEGYLNNTVYFIPSYDMWLLSTLNAPIGWWFAWRMAQHAKDEALRYFSSFVEHYPVPAASDAERRSSDALVAKLVSIKEATSNARLSIGDWYRQTLDIEKPSRKLLDPFDLSADAFVEEVRRGRKGKALSAAALRAVREEHARSIQPMQARLREAERLERELSDLVDAAYGLTPDEVRLMWRTAPPRMPLTPPMDESAD